ncbi:MAG: Uma2 family endonuclease [Candidatus Rokuibacteriota bacterium]
MGRADVNVKIRRWKRVEYERLIESGFFQPGDAVELVGGAFIVAEPQGSRHFAGIQAAEEALRTAFGPDWQVRGQGPLALDDESLPEPDVAVVPGSYRDYVVEHPARPVLIVEVSESSLSLDREHKGSLYARAGVADYWIVNLVDQVVEVYREPAPDPAAPYGVRYRSIEMLGRETSVSPLASPRARIRVADLLV